MSSQPVPFDWQQIDESLVNLMMAEMTAEFFELSREDLQHIRYQNVGNGNGLTEPSQRLEMHLLRTDELAARRYAMYCEVWRCQQKPLSPEFLRAICPNGLRVLVSARKNSITSEFKMEQERTGRPDVQWLQAATDEFKRGMERLYAKWQRLAEIDAKTLEHMLAIAQNGLDIDIVGTQVVHARTQLRIAETRITSLEALMTICEKALSATQMREPDNYRIKNLEQRLENLKTDKKRFEIRRDSWQRSLDIALRRSAKLRTQDIPGPLLTGEQEEFHRSSERNDAPPHLISESNHVISPALEKELSQAQERVRHFEVQIAAVETQITAFQQSLTQAIVQGKSAFKPRDIDKAIRNLHSKKKELEFRRDDWKLSLKSVLLRLEAEQKAGSQVPLSSADVHPLVSGESQDRRNEQISLNDASREPHLEVARKLNYVSPIKRAIALALTIDPDLSDLKICRRFDEDGGVDLPKHWQTDENRSFEHAYKDSKHRRKIEVLISRVRTDMRKKGLLS
jgi:hypothetical protein